MSRGIRTGSTGSSVQTSGRRTLLAATAGTAAGLAGCVVGKSVAAAPNWSHSSRWFERRSPTSPSRWRRLTLRSRSRGRMSRGRADVSSTRAGREQSPGTGSRWRSRTSSPTRRRTTAWNSSPPSSARRRRRSRKTPNFATENVDATERWHFTTPRRTCSDRRRDSERSRRPPVREVDRERPLDGVLSARQRPRA